MSMITSIEEYVLLASNDDAESHDRICNDHASHELWLTIIAQRPDLLRHVTLNKHLPEDVVRALAFQENSTVKLDIASRRSLPYDVFDTLANDSEETVRARIAWNKKTPEVILVRLSKDPNPLVSGPAQKQLERRRQSGAIK